MAIGNFLKSRVFIPTIVNFSKPGDFLSQALGILQKFGNLYPLGLGIFIPDTGNFLKSLDLHPRGLRIFVNLGIFIQGVRGSFKIWGFISLGIGDFQKSGDFYPGDWGCLKIWGIFRGFLGDGDFLSLDGISHHKPSLFISNRSMY